MGAERDRGDKWAARMVRHGGWVMKLPASVTAGIPDWLHAWPGGGLRLVEVKTLEACIRAGIPWEACSKAQQYVLRMVEQHAGSQCAAVLVVGEEGYQELTLAEANVEGWMKRFRRRQRSYV